MKLNRHIFISAIFLLIMACTEEVTVIPFSYPQVFAGEEKRGWTVRSVQLLQAGKGTQTFNLSPCALDDIYIFYNNFERSYQVTEGNSKCNPEDPNLIVNSNWSFVNSTATLTMVMPLLSSDPIPFILKEADDTKIVIDIYFDEDKSSYRFNFKPATVE
jgi:hypothetical protein